MHIMPLLFSPRVSNFSAARQLEDGAGWRIDRCRDRTAAALRSQDVKPIEGPYIALVLLWRNWQRHRIAGKVEQASRLTTIIGTLIIFSGHFSLRSRPARH